MRTYFTKLFVVLLFLQIFSLRLFSQSQWSVVSSPTLKNLNSVFFADSLNGWIGGDSGVIIHTTNNGQNWILQNSGVTNSVTSIFFLNENTGYALSLNFDNTPPKFYGTNILYTTNGGDNWNNYLFRDTNVFLNTIYFYDLQHGYMGGSGGNLYYTTDSGIEWKKSASDSVISSVFPVEKIKFANSQTGYASGGAFDIAGVTWKTTNGGVNWRSTIVGPEPLNDLYIFDSVNVICVGGDFEYGASNVITSNSGANWNYSEFGVFGISRAIDFRTSEEAWIPLGIVDSFLVTTNKGASWNLSPSPPGAYIYDLVFTNSRNGWAIGNNGYILKFNSQIISVSEANNFIPESMILFQNYPNPFNPDTKIRYQINVSSNINLTVYDALGKEIKSLVNEWQNSGIYEVNFNGENYPSGIYFIKLMNDENGQTGNSINSVTKRMLLLK